MSAHGAPQHASSEHDMITLLTLDGTNKHITPSQGCPVLPPSTEAFTPCSGVIDRRIVRVLSIGEVEEGKL